MLDIENSEKKYEYKYIRYKKIIDNKFKKRNRNINIRNEKKIK
jgi:hypothetical protein